MTGKGNSEIRVIDGFVILLFFISLLSFYSLHFVTSSGGIVVADK